VLNFLRRIFRGVSTTSRTFVSRRSVNGGPAHVTYVVDNKIRWDGPESRMPNHMREDVRRFEQRIGEDLHEVWR
jgi:hypothetical protein